MFHIVVLLATSINSYQFSFVSDGSIETEPREDEWDSIDSMLFTSPRFVVYDSFLVKRDGNPCGYSHLGDDSSSSISGDDSQTSASGDDSQSSVNVDENQSTPVDEPNAPLRTSVDTKVEVSQAVELVAAGKAGQANGEIVVTASVKNEMTQRPMLSMAFMRENPKMFGGLVALGSLFALVSVVGVFTSIFMHSPKHPSPANYYTDMQSTITSQITSYFNNQLNSKQSLTNEVVITSLNDGYQIYLNATARNDFDSKVQALNALFKQMDALRLDSDIFIHSNVFASNTTSTYLLKHDGSDNLCLGPRTEGDGSSASVPFFSSDTKKYGHSYNLFNCSDPAIQNQIGVQLIGNQWIFISDKTTDGKYCVDIPSNPEDAEIIANLGTKYGVSSSCESSWSSVESILANNSSSRIKIVSSSSESGNASLVCGCGSVGSSSCQALTCNNQCNWIVSDQENSCSSTFTPIALHPSLPASRIALLLPIYPWLLTFNMLVLQELYLLKNEKYVLQSCNNTLNDWKNAFNGLSAYYRQLPAMGDDLKWLDDLATQMNNVTNRCQEIADEIRIQVLTNLLNSTDFNSTSLLNNSATPNISQTLANIMFTALKLNETNDGIAVSAIAESFDGALNLNLNLTSFTGVESNINPGAKEKEREQGIIFSSVIAGISIISIPFMFLTGPAGLIVGAVVTIVISVIILVQDILRRQRSPRSQEIFNAIQADITSVAVQLEQGIQMDEQSISVIDLMGQLTNQFTIYEKATNDQDLVTKLEALDTIRFLFDQARSGSAIFVAPSFLKTKAPHYLLKQHGTDLCFGPRNNNGVPIFWRADDGPYGANYNLFNCSDPTIQVQIRMKNINNQWTFTEDQTSMGQYCALWHHAQSYEKGLMYKMQTPCGAPETPWNSYTGITSPDGNQVIIAGNNPNGDRGASFLTCGAGADKNGYAICNDAPSEFECYYAQNKRENDDNNDNYQPVRDQSLFEDSQGQCFSIFDIVPIHASIPPIRAQAILQKMPIFAALNLAVLQELYAIRNDPVFLWEHDLVKTAYNESFVGLSDLYKKLPVYGDNLSWLTNTTTNLVNMMEADSQSIAKTFRDSASQLVVQNITGQNISFTKDDATVVKKLNLTWPLIPNIVSNLAWTNESDKINYDPNSALAIQGDAEAFGDNGDAKAFQAQVSALAVTTSIMLAVMGGLATTGPSGWAVAAVILVSVVITVVIDFLVRLFVKPHILTPNEVSSQIQSNTVNLYTSYGNSVTSDAQELAFQNFLSNIQLHMTQYQNASVSGDFNGKFVILQTMMFQFLNLRASSDLFVPGDFATNYTRMDKDSTVFYLLRQAGTSMCFGPRFNKANGGPQFVECSDDCPVSKTYQLFDCTNPSYQNQIYMMYNGKQWTFPQDSTTGGQFCPLGTRGQPGWMDNHGYAYGINSPCQDGDSWEYNSGAVFSEDNSQTVIYNTKPPNGDVALTLLICGCGTQDWFSCDPGLACETDCRFGGNQADWDSITGPDPNLLIPFSQGGNPLNQAYSVFDKLPYIPSLPLERVEKLLKTMPNLMNMNLLILTELYVIKTDSFIESEFNTAVSAWNSSWTGLSTYYRNFFQNSNSDLSWLDELNNNVSHILSKVNLKESSDKIREAILHIQENKTFSN